MSEKDPILFMQQTNIWRELTFRPEKFNTFEKRKAAFLNHLSNIGVRIDLKTPGEYEKISIQKFKDGDMLKSKKKDGTDYQKKMKRDGFALYFNNGSTNRPVAYFYSNQRWNRKKDQEGEKDMVNMYMRLGEQEADEQMEDLAMRIEGGFDKGSQELAALHNEVDDYRSGYQDVEDINDDSDRIREVRKQSEKLKNAELKRLYQRVCLLNIELNRAIIAKNETKIKKYTEDFNKIRASYSGLLNNLTRKKNVDQSELRQLESEIFQVENMMKAMKGEKVGKHTSHLEARSRVLGGQVFDFVDHKEFGKSLAAFNKKNKTNYMVQDFEIQGNKAYLLGYYNPTTRSYEYSGPHVNLSTNRAPESTVAVATASQKTDDTFASKEVGGVAQDHYVRINYYQNRGFDDLLYAYEKKKDEVVDSPTADKLLIERAIVYKVMSGIANMSAKETFSKLGGGDLSLGKRVFAEMMADTIFAADNVLGGDLVAQLNFNVYNAKKVAGASQNFSNSGTPVLQQHGYGHSVGSVAGTKNMDDIIVEEAIKLLQNGKIRGKDGKVYASDAIADVFKSGDDTAAFTDKKDAADVFRTACSRLNAPLGDDYNAADLMQTGTKGLTKMLSGVLQEDLNFTKQSAEKVEAVLNTAVEVADSVMTITTMFHGARAGMNYLWGGFKALFSIGDKGAADFTQGAASLKSFGIHGAVKLGLDFAQSPHDFLENNFVSKHLLPFMSPTFKDYALKKEVVKRLQGLEATAMSDMTSNIIGGRPANELLGPGKLINATDGKITVDINILPSLATNPNLQEMLKNDPQKAKTFLEQLAQKMATSLANDYGLTPQQIEDYQNSPEPLLGLLDTNKRRIAELTPILRALPEFPINRVDILKLPETEYQEKIKLLKLVTDQKNRLDNKPVLNSADPLWLGNQAGLDPAKKLDADKFAKILTIQEKTTTGQALTAKQWLTNQLRLATAKNSPSDASTELEKYFKGVSYLANPFFYTGVKLQSKDYWKDTTLPDTKDLYHYFTNEYNTITGVPVSTDSYYDASIGTSRDVSSPNPSGGFLPPTATDTWDTMIQ